MLSGPGDAYERGTMAEDRKPAKKPDPRGGPLAMVSALATAGLIFAAAIGLHYGKLPAFLVPATAIGTAQTFEGQVASQSVALVVTVPEAAKLSEPKAKADREDQHVATIMVTVQNDSPIPVDLDGTAQSLRTDLARSYSPQSARAVQVAPGKTRTVKLSYLIPHRESPATLTLKMAGQEKKFDVS